MSEQAKILRDRVRSLIVTHATLDDTRRPCGTPLSMPHAWTLLELKKGPLTVNHLAERLNIDRTNVSRLCIKMEDLGEIRRIPNPEDGRSKVLELTEKGSRLANQVDRSSAEHFSRVLEALPNPNTVLHALDQLIAAFQAEPSKENP